jgi:hypothetical protein
MNNSTLEDGIGAMAGIFGTLRKVSNEHAASDEPTIHILVAPDE